MVVLPYKDSLLLFSRYLQQLVMESLGKEFDLDGNRVSATFRKINVFYSCLSNGRKSERYKNYRQLFLVKIFF